MKASDLNIRRIRHERHMTLSSGTPLQHSSEVRRCFVSGCNAKLSRYNPDGVCGVHGGWSDPDEPRRRRGRDCA